jgi:LytS/YehU family sensor histidine kinase
MEGVDRYEKWSASMEETDQLRKVFRQTQLQGLKSQLNPHFLFNSLNSLSSLISEDEEKAEQFLNEMSKVYRYMLRNDDEQLVTVATELQFIDSYFFLLHARYGEGIQLTIDVSEYAAQALVPPLSLQILLENALTQNSISKIKPLKIAIRSVNDACLEVRNNRQPKIINNTSEIEAGVDLLVNKYRLLSSGDVVIEDGLDERLVRLPLIKHHEEVEA